MHRRGHDSGMLQRPPQQIHVEAVNLQSPQRGKLLEDVGRQLLQVVVVDFPVFAGM